MTPAPLSEEQRMPLAGLRVQQLMGFGRGSCHCPGFAMDQHIDQIDPFGNYEPGNFRWVTSEESRRNTRKSALKRQQRKESRNAA
jgi:hypothetical protein